MVLNVFGMMLDRCGSFLYGVGPLSLYIVVAMVVSGVPLFLCVVPCIVCCACC